MRNILQIFRTKFLPVILLFLFLGLPIQAQLSSGNPHFTNISVKDGLSQGTVYCTYHDKAGFMWFGTGDGLNKYNGYEFTTFKHRQTDTTSISNNIINCITQDKDGCLWIGTTEGVNCYIPQTNTFTHYLHIPGDTTSLSNNYVKSILIDSHDNIWLGTDSCLNQFNRETKQFIKYSFDGLLTHSRIYTILEDSYGDIWLGTQHAGIIRFNPQSFRYKQYRHNAADIESISANQVYTLYEDSHRQL